MAASSTEGEVRSPSATEAGGTNAANGEAEPAELRRCDGTPPLAPRLESYVGVQVPGRYWLEMVFRDGEWQPAQPLAMPSHHATRLELTNLAEFARLAGHQPQKVRVTLDIISREVTQVAGRHQWRVTYEARIVQVCLAPNE